MLQNVHDLTAICEMFWSQTFCDVHYSECRCDVTFCGLNDTVSNDSIMCL